MPTTVRRRTRPASPAARPQKAANPGAVKHGRSSPSRHSSEAGRFRDGSIGGVPPDQAGKNTAPVSPLIPPKHPPKPPNPASYDTPPPPPLSSPQHRLTSTTPI